MIKKYKPSKYNIVIEEKNEYVYLYNSKNNATIKIEIDKYKSLVNGTFYNVLSAYEIKKLIELKILVSDDLDEFEEIRRFGRNAQYTKKNNKLELIIVPTMACNYKCVYCFQECVTDKSVMTVKTFDSIIKFIDNYLKDHKYIKYISVIWFGGEPLLQTSHVILPLSKKIISFCKERNINYKASVITNGYYLDAECAKTLLYECKIDYFQITFDGMESEYYQRKRAPKGAYERVKNNLLYLSQYVETKNLKVQIVIRINVDKYNIVEVKKLVLEIKEYLLYNKSVFFYLERLKGNSTAYYTAIEFNEKRFEFDLWSGKNIELPKLKDIFCYQHTMNSFCIGPCGELYKCEHHIGDKERIIGHIDTGITNEIFLEKFLKIEIDEKCKNCRIYPICLGGCPNDRLNNHENKCEYTQDYINKYIKFILEKEEGKNGNNYTRTRDRRG